MRKGADGPFLFTQLVQCCLQPSQSTYPLPVDEYLGHLTILTGHVCIQAYKPFSRFNVNFVEFQFLKRQ